MAQPQPQQKSAATSEQLGEIRVLYIRGEALTAPTTISVLIVGPSTGARLGCKRIEHVPGIGFRAVLQQKRGAVGAFIVPYAQCIVEEVLGDEAPKLEPVKAEQAKA